MRRSKVLAAIFFVGVALTLGSSRILLSVEQDQIQQRLHQDVRQLEVQVRQFLLTYLFASEWIVRELKHSPVPLQQRWSTEAQALLEFYPAIRHVLWLDQEFKIRFSTSADTANSYFRPEFDNQQLRAELERNTSGRVLTSDAGSLSPNEDDIVIVGQVQQTIENGYFAVVVDLDSFLDRLIRTQITEGYQLEIRDRDRLIFQFAGESTLRDSWSVTQPLNILDNQWQIILWPTEFRLEAMYSAAIRLVFWGGVSLTLCAMLIGWRLLRHREANDALRRHTRELERKQQNLRATEQQLAYLSERDELTGIANRNAVLRYLDDNLPRLEQQQGQLAAFHIKIDRFGELNRTLGHQIGDDVLKRVAHRLKKLCPEKGLVARISGDNFALLIPDMKQSQQAENYARSIIDSIQQQIFTNQQEVHCSVSIGIAFASAAGFNGETLIVHASTALNHAKQQGFYAVSLYNSAQQQKLEQRLELMAKLRHAVDHNRVEVHYQPIFDLRTGLIVATEALLRLRMDDDSLVEPEAFLPVIGNAGLMSSLTEAIIKTAFQQLREWHKQGNKQLSVALNLSTRQLALPCLPELLSEYIKRHQLPADRVQLEISDADYLQLCQFRHARFQQLSKTGIRLSIHHSGVTQDSLKILTDCPPHMMKVGGELVASLPTDQTRSKLVEMLIALAQHLQLPLVAVGVENQQQVDFLLQRDCALAQGFYLSRPLTAQQLSAKLVSPRSEFESEDKFL
ncbi:putative bifunctional diguanylate cyclase/phosphodiesterase [Pseudidiomarina sp.]|uniref:putative bifunctional diguanylate cyclase/phosphodiesterase n=1 Tax=Pseudidiomarina sp. TaxID=2081707 RepID=UPI00299EFB59|nr:EAL domain-containing protein [Pseudidiomarina sp.]MDX1704827.1 EAL domain-containing protein [Pseudidiomarina sp.]